MATGVAMGAGKKAALAAMGMFSGVGVVTAYKLDQSVKADLTLHPPHLHWSHSGMIDSLDHASVRRGYQVYKQVCAACHSLRYMACRNLVGVSHTEAEAKAEAEEIQTMRSRMSKRIVVIGSTGSGKSSFCNILAGKDADDDLFPVGHDMQSKTWKTKVAEVKWRGDGIPITIIDTPGLDDPRGPKKDGENIAEMVKHLKELGHVNLFVIVINAQVPRMHRTMQELLKIFKDMFGESFLENTVFEFTRWYYDAAEIRRRKKQNKTEVSMEKDLNKNLRDVIGFNPPKDIPALFIDSHYDEEDETHVENFEMNMTRLLMFLENSKEYSSNEFKEQKREIEKKEEEAEKMRKEAEEARKRKEDADKKAREADIARKKAELAQENAEKQKEALRIQHKQELKRMEEVAFFGRLAGGMGFNPDYARDEMARICPWKDESWYVSAYNPCGGFDNHCGAPGNNMMMRHHGLNYMYGHSNSTPTQQQIQEFYNAVDTCGTGHAENAYNHIKDRVHGFKLLHVVGWGNGWRAQGDGPAYAWKNNHGKFSAAILF